MLGTLPGEESLRRGEYYAHPRNLFWPIVFALFGETPPSLYADRVRFVLERRIAVWDVCASAQRVASADTSIAGEAPNPIDSLIDEHHGIAAIAFNGSGARRLYDRHFARRPELRYFALPSTSPAHARLGLPEKLAQWDVLREVLIDQGRCAPG